MHVLVIPSWYPHPNIPSSGIFFKEQAEALNLAGEQVGVVAPIRRSIRTLRPFSPENKSSLKSTLPTFTEEYFAIPKASVLNDWRHIAIGKRLFEQYVDQFGLPDIIHAHSALQGGHLAFKISDQYRIPYILTEHSSAYGRALLSSSELALSAMVFDHAKRLIAVSKALAKDLEKSIAATSGRWEIIPNSVQECFFQEMHEVDPKSLKPFTFLSIAHLNKNKDIESLIRAAHELSRHREDFQIRIGGSGEELDNLNSLAKGLGISKSVVFLGNLSRSEVIQEMANCDVFVLPSRYETFGVVIIEALALGRPVIATSCGGPNEIINARNGKLVPIGDALKLSQAMANIWACKSEFSSKQIQNDCRSIYSSKAVAEAYISVYREVASSSEYLMHRK